MSLKIQSQEQVSTNNINSPNFKGENTSQTEKKKSYLAANAVLGTLATIGVLGMADVLICKGRHINKLTGKGKELENALTRATNAEENLAANKAKMAEASLIREKYHDYCPDAVADYVYQRMHALA